MEFGFGEGGVTLLHYGPCLSQPRLVSNPTAAKDRFLSKLRRRSRSAPRRTKEPRPAITYSANGEKVRPSERAEDGVELVGFSTPSNLAPDPGRRNPAEASKTSAELKEERRARTAEMTGRWRAGPDLVRGGFDPADGGLSIQPPAGRKLTAAELLLADRAEYLSLQRQLFRQQTAELQSSSSEVFSQFRQEREERLRRLTGGLLAQSAFFSGRDNVLGSERSAPPSRQQDTGGPRLLEGVSENRSAPDRPGDPGTSQPGEPIRPSGDSETHPVNSRDSQASDKNTCPTSTPAPTSTPPPFSAPAPPSTSATSDRRERVIPIQVLNEPMLPRLGSEFQGGAVPDPAPSCPPLPSLFSDLKLDPRHPTFDHPRLTAGGFALGRLGTAFGDDISAFRSGIRDSFFGIPNFGKFPSFGPILAGDSLNLSPHTRRPNAEAKKRLQKSRSTTESPKSSFR